MGEQDLEPVLGGLRRTRSVRAAEKAEQAHAVLHRSLWSRPRRSGPRTRISICSPINRDTASAYAVPAFEFSLNTTGVPTLEALRTVGLSGTMPSSGIERISRTSSTFIISALATRAGSQHHTKSWHSPEPSPFPPPWLFLLTSPRTRSLPHTNNTPQLATTTASSAKYMARCAPRSTPAGLSQRMKSNSWRSSLTTFSTPSRVSASLSQGCEGGRIDRLSRPRSLIRAFVWLVSP